jgi:hypothetical protein
MQSLSGDGEWDGENVGKFLSTEGDDKGISRIINANTVVC